VSTLPPTFSTGFPIARPAMNAASIGATEFSPVRKGGLDRDDVMAFVGRVADHVAELEGRIQELETELTDLRRRPAPTQEVRDEAYDQASSRVGELLRTFDRDVERMRAEAQAEAGKMLDEARAEAERHREEAEFRRQLAEGEAARVVTAATEEADRVREDARRQADDLLSSLQDRREGLVESIRRMREGLARTAQSLDSMLGAVDDGAADVVVLRPDADHQPDRAP
jgi:cell division septum initiation protein DivIVA